MCDSDGLRRMVTENHVLSVGYVLFLYGGWELGSQANVLSLWNTQSYVGASGRSRRMLMPL